MPASKRVAWNKGISNVIKTCVGCGKKFHGPQWSMKTQKYCSRSCAKKFFVFSEKTKKQMSKNRKNFYIDNPNTKCGFQKGYPKPKNAYTFKKGHIVSEDIRKKISETEKGKTVSEKTRKKMSISIQGIDKKDWTGFVAINPYGFEFTNNLRNIIRTRDNFICQMCGKVQKTQKHSIHHINYNKKNNDPKNLICLCRSCHTKTNWNRKKWIQYFLNKMENTQ